MPHLTAFISALLALSWASTHLYSFLSNPSPEDLELFKAIPSVSSSICQNYLLAPAETIHQITTYTGLTGTHSYLEISDPLVWDPLASVICLDTLQNMMQSFEGNLGELFTYRPFDFPFSPEELSELSDPETAGLYKGVKLLANQLSDIKDPLLRMPTDSHKDLFNGRFLNPPLTPYFPPTPNLFNFYGQIMASHYLEIKSFIESRNY